MAMKGEVANIIKTSSNQDQSGENTVSENSSMTLGKERLDSEQEILEEEEAKEQITTLQPIRHWLESQIYCLLAIHQCALKLANEHHGLMMW